MYLFRIFQIKKLIITENHSTTLKIITEKLIVRVNMFYDFNKFENGTDKIITSN